jgi:hypothetical protein
VYNNPLNRQSYPKYLIGAITFIKRGFPKTVRVSAQSINFETGSFDKIFEAGRFA